MIRLPKVKAASAFYDREGNLKATGPLSALPFNPHPYDRCPNFRISFNGEWVEMELLDAADTQGWVAVGKPDWNSANLDATPKIELRR